MNCQEYRPDLKYWLAVHSFGKFGAAKFRKLREHFPDLESVFKASANELMRAGIKENEAQEFTNARISIQPDAILEQVLKEQIEVVVVDDPFYPQLLKEIYDAPPVLYYKGSLLERNDLNLAVVGTRNHTSYGAMAVKKIVSEMVPQGFTIVSGLALGIDALAHDATLAAQGRTIGVLGSGIDRKSIYPSQNRYLADKIVANGGAIVSEYFPGTWPAKHHFPQRNRIISGLSLGVLVIEAGEKSGSLITAQYALDQNRDIFVIPGTIFSELSAGANSLIQKGAKLVTSGADILEALDLNYVNQYISKVKVQPENEIEAVIFNNLLSEPKHVDELVRLTNLSIGAINSALVMMEMRGLVKNLGGMKYMLLK